MAAEEFQESEVIFADHDDCYRYVGQFDHRIRAPRIYNNSENGSNYRRNERPGTGSTGTASSLPVNIPAGATVFRCSDACGDEFDGGEMEPPHVILGRRIGRKMAFSVCTGNGRTLKGRDLSRVRNSVLRKTGFLET